MFSLVLQIIWCLLHSGLCIFLFLPVCTFAGHNNTSVRIDQWGKNDHLNIIFALQIKTRAVRCSGEGEGGGGQSPLNPFRTPKSLPIVVSSQSVPPKRFPVVKALMTLLLREGEGEE